jgi:hypothetical protein
MDYLIDLGIDGITLVHLPEGPTAYFKLTSIELTKQIFVCPLPLLSKSKLTLTPYPLSRAMPEQPHTTPN